MCFQKLAESNESDRGKDLQQKMKVFENQS